MLQYTKSLRYHETEYIFLYREEQTHLKQVTPMVSDSKSYVHGTKSYSMNKFKGQKWAHLC